MENKQVLVRMRDAIINGEAEIVEKTVLEAISTGMDPIEILRNGLERGLTTIGERWMNGEVFLSQMMMAADSMRAGMVLLKPKIMEMKGKEKEIQKLGTIVIGTTYGDMHNIGKDMVATMLEVAGFEIHDLGVDVPTMKFIEKAEEVKADILALSCLLSPSLYYQRDVISYLKDMGVRDKYWIMVGGGPVTPDWVREIGADGYAKNATQAAEVAKLLIQKGKEAGCPIIRT